jgi:hypothetical protein
MESLAQQEDSIGKYKNLVVMARPLAVFEEVCRIVSVLTSHFNFTSLYRVFQDVVKLFRGEYPGYQKCNTWYHNLKHTTDCLLAMARLIHGGSINGLNLPERDVALGLIAALFHDTGYIQKSDDLEGTGAKYTIVHVERSVAFMEQYFAYAGFSSRDLDYCRCCVHCTALEVKIRELRLNLPRIRQWAACWDLLTCWDRWRIAPIWNGYPFFIGSSRRGKYRDLSPRWTS